MAFVNECFPIAVLWIEMKIVVETKVRLIFRCYVNGLKHFKSAPTRRFLMSKLIIAIFEGMDESLL